MRVKEGNEKAGLAIARLDMITEELHYIALMLTKKKFILFNILYILLYSLVYVKTVAKKSKEHYNLEGPL